MSFVGSLLTIPYILAFYLLWIVSSLTRPLIWATFVCLCLNPIAAKKKLSLFANTFRYMIFCHDKTWNELKKPEYSVVHKVEKKTVIFVRHGESTWNESFNKGFVWLIPGLLKALIKDWYFLITAKAQQSWLYDSPLNSSGLAQSEGIRTFLTTDLTYSTPKEARMIRLMLGDPPDSTSDGKGGSGVAKREPSSQLISSNLRRAISTLAIGMKDRLDRRLEGDKILILQELQEISRNPDALCITPPKGELELTFTDPKFLKPIFKDCVDTSMHKGNKPVDTNGLKRLNAFCHLLFKDVKKESAIVAGHSLWFRSFFRTYLPKDYDHIAKVKKIQNGGCVGFTLEKKTTDKGDIYEITPGSIVVLYIGF